MAARRLAEFELLTLPAAVVLRVRGELDVTAAPSFRLALQEARAADRPLIVVDLAAVSFLDSAGLSAVVGLKRQLPVGQRLALVHVPTKMLKMLRVAAISALVEVHPEGEAWPWPDVPEPVPADSDV